jgi:sorbose reductase
LAGKTAVITGAARGLGFAFAQALAEAGANIAILDIVEPSEAALFELRSQVIIALYYKTDVTSRENVYDVVAQVEKDFGSIDIKYDISMLDSLEPNMVTNSSIA